MTYETMSGMDELIYILIHIYTAINKLCYMDIYIGISGDFDPPNYLNDKVHFCDIPCDLGTWASLLTEDGACHRQCGQAGGIISSSGGVVDIG